MSIDNRVNAETVAANYIAVWNETDAGARRKLIEETWVAEGTYVDPMAELAGHDQIDAGIAGVQEAFAGLVFTLGPVDAHHDVARFTWNLGLPGAEPIVIGFDVITIAEDGRIKNVLGFLDKVPA
ncbi:isomerase [Actinorhabdospora filicis]|uniref:Isomerase n=1 Tax=Actinorhabdospora filicis TaxID=1785913 RepID=A0A9W6SP03_9ACTN|nr:nuclear transport factor 2 family protein [Actinorhabdospora filicis]GLZ79728.1 isomerase [Actinorhabdospora filicis]